MGAFTVVTRLCNQLLRHQLPTVIIVPSDTTLSYNHGCNHLSPDLLFCDIFWLFSRSTWGTIWCDQEWWGVWLAPPYAPKCWSATQEAWRDIKTKPEVPATQRLEQQEIWGLGFSFSNRRLLGFGVLVNLWWRVLINLGMGLHPVEDGGMLTSGIDRSGIISRGPILQPGGCTFTMLAVKADCYGNLFLAIVDIQCSQQPWIRFTTGNWYLWPTATSLQCCTVLSHCLNFSDFCSLLVSWWLLFGFWHWGKLRLASQYFLFYLFTSESHRINLQKPWSAWYRRPETDHSWEKTTVLEWGHTAD